MENLRVLIADASTDFSRKMADAIQCSGDFTLAGVIPDGSLVADGILRLRPDILLLELMLPGCDGISIIRNLKGAQNQGWLPVFPITVVLSAIISEPNTYLLRDAGIDYYMVKPVPPLSVLERLRDLRTALHRPVSLPSTPFGNRSTPFETDDIACDLTSLLIDIGIPASLSGYTYLREAIRMVIDNGIAPDGMLSKQIYPALAKRHGKSVASVEKAIRTAIETAWIRGRTDLLDQLFGYTVSAQRGKPTNTEFIAMIADRYAVYGKVK